MLVSKGYSDDVYKHDLSWSDKL